MFQEHYSRFLAARPNLLHFAAHSHHYWPDVTRDAQMQCWDDAARLADEKWGYIFSEIVPKAQRRLAAGLGLSDYKQICFAPNTHELLVRLLSCLDPAKPRRILTTDSEFHSCSRQLTRLEERGDVTIDRIPSEPFGSFAERFCQAAQHDYDMVYLSHVFFNSGFVVQNLDRIVSSVTNPKTIIAIDGYHALGAVPVNISTIQNRVFYLGGAYKYLQGGEGACFMTVPAQCSLRPESTGWFATFSNLETIPASGEQKVAYSSDAFRFWGATFDPVGLYRLIAVYKLFAKLELTPEKIHSYVQSLQSHFIERMDSSQHPFINRRNLLIHSLTTHGHFFTFKFPEAQAIHKQLRSAEVITDVRGDRLRFGFGLYQTKANIDELFRRINS